MADGWVDLLRSLVRLVRESSWRSSRTRVSWGSPHRSLRQRFTLGQFLAWWFVFKQLKQSLLSHAIFLLSCRVLDLKTRQKATGCLYLQMTHVFSLAGTFFYSLPIIRGYIGAIEHIIQKSCGQTVWIPKLTFQCFKCSWVAMTFHTQTLHCFLSFPIKILEQISHLI